MDRYQLARQLQSILLDLEKAEEAYFQYRARLADIKYRISLKESELVVSTDLIDGKNEDTRKRQLFHHTSSLHKEKTKVIEQLEKAKRRVEGLERKYQTAQLTIRLLLTPGFEISFLDESILS
ncbi:hypothetical protein SAMN05444392_103235 [Seinonella peptonophila]|uniref:Uncharacterized protein n=1 Tax=Seinonella peptonophila TaxID=112248 RepID=A0A1M4WI97_9BACL|nr:hypothetical protein [Seinonella peptonophila]SHE80969.1 hypothetical protein SAMN05444392_103235 [Seinonella peptonophila]